MDAQQAIIKALANDARMQILIWLKNPQKHFPKAVAADTLKLGVCCGLIQEKIGLSQSTVSNYLSILERAGLLIATRDKQWTYYKRNGKTIANFIKSLTNDI